MKKTKQFTKHELAELAAKNELAVTFTKTDGTERTMFCSLMIEHVKPLIKSMINNDIVPVTDGHPDILAVVDLEKGAWRSFKISRVSKVEIIEPVK